MLLIVLSTPWLCNAPSRYESSHTRSHVPTFLPPNKVEDRYFKQKWRITDKQFTVLIVDDDEDLWALLTHSIRAAMPGTVVSCVHSAEKAIDSVTRSVPDAMLLDLQLPGMNGIELLDVPARDAPGRSPRFIAMSARASGGDAANS